MDRAPDGHLSTVSRICCSDAALGSMTNWPFSTLKTCGRVLTHTPEWLQILSSHFTWIMKFSSAIESGDSAPWLCLDRPVCADRSCASHDAENPARWQIVRRSAKLREPYSSE